MRSLPPVQADALARWLASLTAAPDPSRPGQAAATLESLLALITARPWRRSAVDAQTYADLERKVRQAMRLGEPVEFSLPFGGYRGWQLPSYPNLEWAEVFWIHYLQGYACRVALVYPPGVLLSLSYVGGVLSWVNQLPQADLDLYLAQLDRLLQWFSTPLIRFRLVDHSDACGGAEAVLAVLQARAAAMPPADPATLARARRNLRGSADAEAPVCEAAIDAAARRCAALMALEERRAFNKFGPRVQLTHVRGPSLALHIGSCRSAVAQPWVSTGYLQWRQDRGEWIERLATASVSIKTMATQAVSHPLLDLSPALARIPIETEDLLPATGLSMNPPAPLRCTLPETAARADWS